jgi:hypothetical protein
VGRWAFTMRDQWITVFAIVFGIAVPIAVFVIVLSL